MIQTNLEINGNQPNIEGDKLEGLVCQEMLYQGEIHERAHGVFIKCSNIWHRLYFDCGIIFWRTCTEAPKNLEIPETDCYFRNVFVGKDLGLNGLTIQSIACEIVEESTEVTFKFNSDRQITLFDFNDVSDYRT